jgi:hypothetical protein
MTASAKFSSTFNPDFWFVSGASRYSGFLASTKKDNTMADKPTIDERLELKAKGARKSWIAGSARARKLCSKEMMAYPEALKDGGEAWPQPSTSWIRGSHGLRSN